MDQLTPSLVRSLHSVFDREPQRWLFMRVRHSGGLRLTIADETLTLAHASGSDTYDLSALTLSELADQVVADGYEIAYENPAGGHLSARVLLDCDSEQDAQEGDHLFACGSLTWAHMDAIGGPLAQAKAQIAPAISQLILPQSTGAWADLFGRIFGVPRRANESDSVYSERILNEVRRARSNPAAMLQNIKNITGYDVGLREPWKEISTWSQSRLSDSDHLQGDIWQYHTAQITAPDGVDWDAVQAIAEADRPAGTILLGPAWVPLARDITLTPEPSSIVCREDVFSDLVRGLWDPRWDISRASDHDVALNHLFIQDQWIVLLAMMMGVAWVGAWDDRPWSQSGGEGVSVAELENSRSFFRGDAIWSEDTPLGDLNTRFRGAWYYRAEGAAKRASVDLALSDYVVERKNIPILFWEETDLSSSVEDFDDIGSAQDSVRIDAYSAVVENQSIGRIEYNWDAQTWYSSGNARTWGGSTAWFGANYEIKVLAQSATGSTPVWSEEGDLSDYADGMTITTIPYDPVNGTTLTDPWNGATIHLPPRTEV